MKIKLIAPHNEREHDISSAVTFQVQRPNLGLLAALTPAGHSVEIVDEAFLPDKDDGSTDLVGITVMTELAQRAYQLAETYRDRGAKVILGGIHPTVLPDEALAHADTVVIGEAEELWPRVVGDAASGQVKKVYRQKNPSDLKGLPIPRRDLHPMPVSEGYTPYAIGVESSRGCLYDCEFCSVGSGAGRKYRARPVTEVVAEIESIESPYLFFVDDSLALNKRAAKELFREMIPLKKLWVGEGSVSLARDLGLLQLMKRSGCLGLLIGFESVQEKTGHEMKKTRRAGIDFSEAVKRIHGEGLGILGAFIFGFDDESKDVFEQTLDFSLKNRLDMLQLRILCPFPGTRLYKRLFREGRLFSRDWWLHGYSSDTLLFEPMKMRTDEFLEGFSWLIRKSYSLGSMFKRFFGLSPFKRTVVGCRVYAGINMAMRRRYHLNLKSPQPFSGKLRHVNAE